MKDFTVLYGEESLDESMKIEIFVKEAMGFGAQAVKVIMIEPDGDRYEIISDKIYNDGSVLKQKNVGVTWLKDESAEIYIRGKEMETVKYEISKVGGRFVAILTED